MWDEPECPICMNPADYWDSLCDDCSLSYCPDCWEWYDDCTCWMDRDEC